MADNDIRPIESDETYIYDETLPEYHRRARTAAIEYRQTSWPSEFSPPPPDPVDDPDPPSDEDDISPAQSVRVSYYDSLLTGHRGTTETEVTRFGGQLVDYADFYNEHIKKPGEPDYEMPVSQVQPLDIVDDGAERPNESNLVGDYDVASSGYSEISVASMETAGARGTTFEEYMDAANEKLETLANDIPLAFNDAEDKYDAAYNETESGATDQSDMSVMEAGNADIRTIKDSMDELGSTVMDEVNDLVSNISDKVDDMTGNVGDGLIDISEYNALSADMMNYIERGKTYNQFVNERGSQYSDRFTADMMRACWDTNYSNYHS